MCLAKKVGLGVMGAVHGEFSLGRERLVFLRRHLLACRRNSATGLGKKKNLVGGGLGDVTSISLPVTAGCTCKHIDCFS